MNLTNNPLTGKYRDQIERISLITLGVGLALFASLIVNTDSLFYGHWNLNLYNPIGNLEFALGCAVIWSPPTILLGSRIGYARVWVVSAILAPTVVLGAGILFFVYLADPWPLTINDFYAFIFPWKSVFTFGLFPALIGLCLCKMDLMSSGVDA